MRGDMKRMVWVWMIVLAFGAVAVRGQVALDNQSVVKMVRAGLGEEVILSMVQGQPGVYEMTPDSLAELKKDGVTDRVIAAMAAKGPAVTLNDYDGLDIGVYYKAGNATEWTRVPSERVYAKSGGAFKSLATNNIIKQDMNGRLDGQQSQLALSKPLQFLVITPEGIDATDFTLVELTQKKDGREFRTKTGGVFHTSEDVSRSAVPFEQKKLAKHTYAVILPSGVGKGEYAFLAAGLSGASATGSRGKAYTFHVVE